MMSEIRKIIDDKFDVAIEMSLSGKNSIGVGSADIGEMLEIIALDSLRGPDSRCVMARNALGSKAATVKQSETGYEFSVYAYGSEIPREEDDFRKFEELPLKAILGNPFMIDVDQGVLIPRASNSLRKDWRNLENLCGILSKLRVVEKIPEIYTL